MRYYQHQFDSVVDYLHHRPPYLLIDQIIELSEGQIKTAATVTGDEHFIRGHFPGAPILPGAMMQEMTTQSAGILIAAKYNPMAQYNTHDPHFNEYALGVLVKVNSARYRGFVRPGSELSIEVRLNEKVGQMFDFSATVNLDDSQVMRNSFRLTNLLSSTLRGESE